MEEDKDFNTEDELSAFGGGFTTASAAKKGKAVTSTGEIGEEDDLFDINDKLTTDDDEGGFTSFGDDDDFSFNDGDGYSDDY